MNYSGILGHPLKNPRSITIWKSFFLKNNIKCKMLGFDIEPKKLNNFFKKIKKDKNFQAMAVTMPYKKKSLKYVKNLDNFGKSAQSINLIIKKNQILNGYNTDVMGAIKSIKNKIKLYENFLLIGYGGTGSAILNYLTENYKKNFTLISSQKKINKKIKKKCLIKKKIDKTDLQKKQLIIHCTPFGSNLKKSFLYKTPITDNQFGYLNKKSFIFDIVYKPKKTKLCKLSKKYKIKYKNGLEMNTLQAKYALKLLISNVKLFRNSLLKF